MREKRIAGFVLAVICAAWIAMGAYAEGFDFSQLNKTQEPEKTLAPNIQYGLESTDVNIRTVQEKLASLGFYDGNISYEMDNDTMYAIKLFCEANHLEYSADGMTKQAYQALMNEQNLVDNVTPAPTDKDAVVYETLYFGQTSDTILNLQIRLKELGYYEGFQLTPQVYDWDFQSAVDAFCKGNGIAFDPEEMLVSESIQRIIFSEIADARIQTSTPALTATPAPTRIPGMKYILGDTGTDIRNLQEKLSELGYYKDEYTYEFDMNTLYAVNQMCYENRLYSSEYGVSEENWKILFSEENLVAMTPVPTEVPATVVEYADIRMGDSGDAVLQLQIRLKELGYFAGDNMVLGMYDDQTQAAIALFCQFNSISYQGPDISAQLQRAVFAESATPYEVTVVELSFVQKIKAFFVNRQVLLGISLPGYLWTIIAVLLVAGFAVALVLLLTGKPKHTPVPSVSGVQSSVSRSKSESSVADEVKMMLVDVSIRYQNTERRERMRVSDHFLIGRAANCGLVLDESDKSMSRSHCMLLIRGGNLVIRDDSVNGTFVNDKRYHHDECVLHSGDRIQIGKHLLVIKF